MRRIFLLLSWLFGTLRGGGVPIAHWPTERDAPISQSFGYLNHVGVDFNVPVGTRVYNVLPGKVIAACEDSRVYGRFVMVEHEDGNASLYAHLSVLLVGVGDEINGGKVIGLSGGDPRDKIDGDGWSSGAHLHFEVRLKGHLENNLYSIDPLEWLKGYMESCIYAEGRNRCM